MPLHAPAWTYVFEALYHVNSVCKRALNESPARPIDVLAVMHMVWYAVCPFSQFVAVGKSGESCQAAGQQ